MIDPVYEVTTKSVCIRLAVKGDHIPNAMCRELSSAINGTFPSRGFEILLANTKIILN